MILQKDIKIDLYRTTIRIIFTDEIDDVVKKYGIQPTPEFEAITIEVGGNVVVVYPLNTSHGSIVHELLHVVDDILSVRGFKLTEESCEAYAYLIGHVTQQVYSYARKHTEITIN